MEKWRVARGSICGTRDAGRSWYQHFRDRLANKFRVHESGLEKGLYLHEFNGRLVTCSDGTVWNPTISRNHVDIQRTQRVSQFAGKTPMVATSITSRSVIRSESCSTTFQRIHGCRCSSTQCSFSQSSAILGNHLQISTQSDQCFLGSAGDVWRRLFRQHGRFEESVRRHRVLDA